MRVPVAILSLAVAIAVSLGRSVAEPALWTPRQLRILESLSLARAGPPPPVPSNRWADDATAARLGRMLFHDRRLSGNGELSCASCHVPERSYTDGLPRSVGLAEAGRNTPTVVGTAYQAWFYWDGRRDSLWSQALIPFEAAAEMGGSRVAVVRSVGTDPEYRALYESLFGAFPREALGPDLPAHAGPFGNDGVRTAWSKLPPATQRAINGVYANLGKAIEAYERTLLPRETRFDRYVATLLERGEREAAEHLSADEIAGLALFVDDARTQCLQCHNGPMWTNGGFHNIGTGSFTGERLDFGRVLGLRAVLLDEFNCLGPWSDAEPSACQELEFLNRDAHVPLEGAFKTPSLRNVAATAPYGHDGRFRDLGQILRHYASPPAAGDAGPHELKPLSLSATELGQLEALLRALTEIPEPAPPLRDPAAP
jgi:cytochrome c peroxidase